MRLAVHPKPERNAKTHLTQEHVESWHMQAYIINTAVDWVTVVLIAVTCNSTRLHVFLEHHQQHPGQVL